MKYVNLIILLFLGNSIHAQKSGTYLQDQVLIELHNASSLDSPLPPSRATVVRLGANIVNDLYGLYGDGEFVVMKDDSHPLLTHPVFTTSQINIHESHYSPGEHSTKVASVLMGVPHCHVEGIAPNLEMLTMLGFTTPQDFQELHDAIVANDATVGNMSLGSIASSRNGYFGFIFDEIAFNNPNFLLFVCQGNDPEVWGYTWNGWKNNLDVGTVDRDFNLGSSSFGPTSDGRIKPDIVSIGNNVVMAAIDGNGDPSIEAGSGTSFASPAACGGGALLKEYYRDNFQSELSGQTLKSLIIQSAVDLGVTGPDFKYGHGLFDFKSGLSILESIYNGCTETQIIEGEIHQDETLDYNLTVSGGWDTKITMTWFDTPIQLSNNEMQNGVQRLVNDLDIVLIDQNDNKFYPWHLNHYQDYFNDPQNSGLDVVSPAMKGKNERDNVEVIEYSGLPSGTYTLRVSHDGALTFPTGYNSQSFSIVIGELPEVDLVADIENEQLVINNSHEYTSFEWYDQSGSLVSTSMTLDSGTGEFLLKSTAKNGCSKLQRAVVECPPCPGDLNFDNVVNTADLLSLFGIINQMSPYCDEPCNPLSWLAAMSEFVDSNDLLELLANYGNVCP